MSAPKKGQFGEPWEWSDRWVFDSEGIIVGDTRDQSERIVSCANALDGRDPEKLQAVLDAARQACAELASPKDRVVVAEALTAALRDFGEEV